jgi:hypothetical protein
MRCMGFDAWSKRHYRAAFRIWLGVVLVTLAAGYAVGQASSLLIGSVVTIALLVGAEVVYRRVDKAVWLKHFPELDTNPYLGLRWRGWFLKSTERRL